MRRPGADQEIAGQLAALDELGADDLRRRWQAQTGGALPGHLLRPLLLRLLVYRLQADAFGDLRARSKRQLAEIARTHAEKRPSGAGPPSLDSLNLLSREAAPPTPGTVLVREYDGVIHHVMVGTDGYVWGDTTYASLSAVARAITETRWNGRRFFGLTDKANCARPGRTPPSRFRKRGP